MAVWEILTFLLNALLFLLVGLQLPSIIDQLQASAGGELALWGALVSAVVIGVRLAWVFTLPLVLRRVDRRESQRARRIALARSGLVLGWAGIRGSVSLAAALAIPLRTDAGGPFPDRDLIIFLAFVVILVTLIGQGLTLGPLITRARMWRTTGSRRQEEHAREAASSRGRARAARRARRARLDQPRERRARPPALRLPARGASARSRRARTRTSRIAPMHGGG